MFKQARLAILIITVVCSLIWATPAKADSLLLGTGISLGSIPMLTLAGPNVPNTQFLAAGFNLNQPVHVSILKIDLVASWGVSGTAVVQVTNAIGPATTPANVLAQTNVVVPSGPSTQLFGTPNFISIPLNLNLGPGAYYIVASTTQANVNMGWESALTYWPSTVGSIGSAYVASTFASPLLGNPNPSFAPASTWSDYSGFYPYTVTVGMFELVGHPASEVPEPATLLLVGSGIASLWVQRKRNRTRKR